MRYHYDRTDAAHSPHRAETGTLHRRRMGRDQKDLKDVRVRVAFCFPDTYEIGMSNLGMRILYGVMNGMDGVWCERVFAPWGHGAGHAG